MLRETNAVQDNESEVTSSSRPSLPKFKLGKTKDDIDKAIKCFLSGQTGKFGKYVATANALVYRTMITEGTGMNVEQDIIALKIERANETLFVGNSSILSLIGRTVSFGNVSNNRSVTEVQTRLSRHIQMIPFSVFMEAGLNLLNIDILDRGAEETLVRQEIKYDSKLKKNVPHDVEIHYTGASLFKVDGKTFLFDIDRREINHKIFNAFMVQLQTEVSTIGEAYEALKPKEVLDAEAKGLEVLRQGEWFFVPVKGEYEAKKASGRFDKKQYEPMTLQAGRNRPNTVQKYAVVGKNTYVTGTVEHSGREHHPLMLRGWFKPVVNTSIQSFTLTGDVD